MFRACREFFNIHWPPSWIKGREERLSALH
jgi:hypothetical protein